MPVATLDFMSNLMPEKRVDRNGRVVTRHVLSGRALTDHDRSFPAPVTAPPKKRLVTKADYANQIAESLLVETEGRSGTARELEDLGMKTLRRVNRWVDSSDDELSRSIFLRALVNIVHKPNKENIASDRLTNLMLEVMPTVIGFIPEKAQLMPWHVNDVIHAVNYGAKVNYIFFESNGSAETTAILQYIAFEYMVKNVNTARPLDWLREESKWFAENFERLCAHGETIIKRGSTDRDFLDELVASDRALSLGEGTL